MTTHALALASAKLNAQDYRVQLTSFQAARRLVEQHHYTGRMTKSAAYIFGLFRRDELMPVGVSVWQPAVKGSVDKYNPGGAATTLTLSKLVIRPDIPGNAASYLLGQSIRLIKQDGRFDFLITYADTFKGHTGGIYKATNWQYQGLSSDNRLWKMPDGSIRSRGKQHSGSSTLADMEGKGATFLGNFPKHVYTMRLKIHRKPKPKQLELLATA